MADSYAVIFSSRRRPGDMGYDEMAERMVCMAAEQPGFLGMESVRGADGFGITVSYWESLAAIAAWKRVAEHQDAQRLGRAQWYGEYHLRVCKLEYERHFVAPTGPDEAPDR